MTPIYRIQDSEGRGPFKPGFTHFWLVDRPDHDNLVPWYAEFGPVHLKAIAGMAVGCGCLNLEQLRRWFCPKEYATLSQLGYGAVQMVPGRILAQSSLQCVFERVKPLNQEVIPVELYPL